MGRKIVALLMLGTLAVSADAFADKITFDKMKPQEFVEKDKFSITVFTDLTPGVLVLCDGAANKNGCGAGGISDIITFASVQKGISTISLTCDGASCKGAAPPAGAIYWPETNSYTPGVNKPGYDKAKPQVVKTYTIDSPEEPTPEPSSLVLMGTGLAGVAAVTRRRLRR